MSVEAETPGVSFDFYTRLPKIKAWIDEHNAGDNLIPFSVALEERLLLMGSDEEREEELKKIGATSALGKITQSGYQSLDVRVQFSLLYSNMLREGRSSLFGTSRVDLTKYVRGRFGRGRRRPRLLVSSSEWTTSFLLESNFSDVLAIARTLRISSSVVRL